MLIAPSSASAAERVQDGSFEAATCDATQCTDPAWDAHVTSAFSYLIGPICRAGTGSGSTDCTNDGSIPFSGSTWARLGAGYKATAMFGGGIISWLDQSVAIPAAPTPLSFQLRIIDSSLSTGDLKVEIDGTQVFAATDSTPGFASYAPVSIDVSAFAGGTHVLRFEGTSANTGTGQLDSFDIDAISLADQPPAPPPAMPKCNGRLATIAGTAGNDSLVGTPHRDVIASLGGNDSVSGFAGNDLICGGAGRDTLRGGKGRDVLLGQKGRDTLKGGGGKDFCRGGAGKDSAACETERSL
jgi:hypothetical protein